MDRDAELERDLGIEFGERVILSTFHPVTLAGKPSVEQLEEFLAALDRLGPKVTVVITKSNADSQGRAINARIDEFTATRENVLDAFTMGQLRYLSAMIQESDVVVGNSSSGLYEVPVPSPVPTVNIGDRQKGQAQGGFGHRLPGRLRSHPGGGGKGPGHGLFRGRRTPTVTASHAWSASSPSSRDILDDSGPFCSKGFHDLGGQLMADDQGLHHRRSGRESQRLPGHGPWSWWTQPRTPGRTRSSFRPSRPSASPRPGPRKAEYQRRTTDQERISAGYA